MKFFRAGGCVPAGVYEWVLVGLMSEILVVLCLSCV